MIKLENLLVTCINHFILSYHEMSIYRWVRLGQTDNFEKYNEMCEKKKMKLLMN